jgi:hypothetical protein
LLFSATFDVVRGDVHVMAPSPASRSITSQTLAPPLHKRARENRRPEVHSWQGGLGPPLACLRRSFTVTGNIKIRDIKSRKGLLRELSDIANQHLAAMEGMTDREAYDYVKRLADASVIVLGVYPDASSSEGVDIYPIKGLRELETAAASLFSSRIRFEAIPCVDLEQAVAGEEMFGDGYDA